MDGSGRITKRNRQFLKQIFPYKTALQPHSSAQGNGSTKGKSSTIVQLPQNNMSKSFNTGSTADEAGRPCTTGADRPAAKAKSPVNQLPYTDTQDTEIDMTDATFDQGLTQAVYNVLSDEITDKQPEADSVSPSVDSTPVQVNYLLPAYLRLTSLYFWRNFLNQYDVTQTTTTLLMSKDIHLFKSPYAVRLGPRH